MRVIRELARACYNVAASVLRIVRAPRVGSRVRLSMEYARLRMLSVWHRQRSDGDPSRVRFLGRTLTIRSYVTFVYLVEEIFVHQSYRFEAVRPDPVILDVGSNIGLSVLYFKLLHPGAKILAVEPDPESFRLLEKNVRSAGLDGVSLENVAVWDSEDTLTLRGGDPGVGGVKAAVEGGSVDGGGSATQVSAVRFSSLVEGMGGAVDLIKMDVEGAEARCLRELRDRSAFASVREVIVECHHNSTDEPLLTQVLDVLQQEGFRFRIRAAGEGPDAPPEASQDVLVHARRAEVEGGG